MMYGSMASVSNSSIWVVNVYGSSLEMIGCDVDYLNILENSDLKLKNCLIDRLVPGYGLLNMTAKNTQITRYYLAQRTNMILENTNLTMMDENFWQLNITGSFNILNNSLPLMAAYSHNVRIKRTYPLIVTRNGKPLGDAVVYLRKEGETLGEYLSGEQGRTEFNVFFADIYQDGDPFDYDRGNVTDSYKLTVLSSGQNDTRTIDIYTLTPIRIDFKPRANYSLIYAVILATIIIYLSYRYTNQNQTQTSQDRINNLA